MPYIHTYMRVQIHIHALLAYIKACRYSTKFLRHQGYSNDHMNLLNAVKQLVDLWMYDLTPMQVGARYVAIIIVRTLPMFRH